MDDFYGSVSPKQFNSTSEVVQGGLPFDLAGHDTSAFHSRIVTSNRCRRSIELNKICSVLRDSGYWDPA